MSRSENDASTHSLPRTVTAVVSKHVDRRGRPVLGTPQAASQFRAPHTPVRSLAGRCLAGVFRLVGPFRSRTGCSVPSARSEPFVVLLLLDDRSGSKHSRVPPVCFANTPVSGVEDSRLELTGCRLDPLGHSAAVMVKRRFECPAHSQRSDARFT